MFISRMCNANSKRNNYEITFRALMEKAPKDLICGSEYLGNKMLACEEGGIASIRMWWVGTNRLQASYEYVIMHVCVQGAKPWWHAVWIPDSQCIDDEESFGQCLRSAIWEKTYAE